MRSTARAFYIRSLPSSYGRVPTCSTSSSLISQQASFCTESDLERIATETDDDGKEFRHNRGDRTPNSLFLERLRGVPRDRPLSPMLQSWIEAGNELGPFEMKTLFGRLEWKKKFSQALEVVEWLLKERPFDLLEVHYARWLTYLGKVSGYEKVERAFQVIPPKFQKEAVYCRLFDACLLDNKVKEAIAIMKRMRSQKISVPVYMCNNLITYYDKNSMQSKIPALLRVMEEQNILYNLQTFNILLACSSRDFDLERMEQVWGFLQADAYVKPDFVSYSTLASAYFFACEHEKASSAALEAERHLKGSSVTIVRLKKMIALYGSLKQGEGVRRLYDKLKALPGKTSIPSYVCVMEAYGEAGLLERAEEVIEEMKVQSGLHHLAQYNTILGVYCKCGMIEKAKEVLEKLSANHEPNVMTHCYLLQGYLKSKQLKKALMKLKTVVTILEDEAFTGSVFTSRTWLLSMYSVLGLLAEEGDMEHANLLLSALQEARIENFPASSYFMRKAYERSFGCAWVGHAEK